MNTRDLIRLTHLIRPLSATRANPTNAGCIRRASILFVFAAFVPVSAAFAQQSPSGIKVPLPNGFPRLKATDLRLTGTAGEVSWGRQWDGREWKFNPQWESLSQAWTNLTGSQAADTTAGSFSGGTLTTGGGAGQCYIYVDDEALSERGSVLPIRLNAFNKSFGTSGGAYPAPRRVAADLAALCPGVVMGGSSRVDAEAFRRGSELYAGEGGRYTFNNASLLEKRSVQEIPPGAVSGLTSGRITLTPRDNPNGFRWIARRGDWVDYNHQGQVVAWGDRNGNTVWLVRDADGILRGVADISGRVLYSLHYTGELLTEIRDYPIPGLTGDLPARSVKYEYDSHNRLASVIDARGFATRYEYDSDSRIVRITDPEGRIEELAYNGDTIARHTAPDGGVTEYAFEFDDANKQFVSKITGPETAAGRRVEHFTHNRAGQLVRRVANGRTEEERRYDPAGRSEAHINARGLATRYVRNEFGLVTDIIHPDGSSRKKSYSALSLELTEEIDELGVKTQYQNDAKGNLIKITEAVGTADERVTEIERKGDGSVSRITRKGRTEANGGATPDASWRFDTDLEGENGSIRLTDPEGNVRRFEYNRSGNLIARTDPRGHTTRYELDAHGNVTRSTDALGHTRQFKWDQSGRLVGHTDARGKKIEVTRDALTRLKSLRNAVGGIRQITHNAEGRLASATDEDGRRWQWDYDNFLRVIRQTDGLENVTHRSYNLSDGSAEGAVGSLEGPTEMRFPTFTLAARYDERERPSLLRIDRASSDGKTTTTSSYTRTYDKTGRLTSETDPHGKTRRLSYNALGQVTEITDTLGGRTRVSYDTRGNLIAFTDAKGNTTQFEYDRNSRLIKETRPMGQILRFGYDENGNRTSLTDPLGNRQTRVFDAANRPITMQMWRAAPGGSLTLERTVTYTWNENNQLTGWSEEDLTRPAAQRTTRSQIDYDDAGRKVAETLQYANPQGGTTPLGYRYGYSLAGKKTQLTLADGTRIEYSYTAHGRLETVGIPGEGTISMGAFKWTAPTRIILPGGAVRTMGLDGTLKPETVELKSPGQQTVMTLANSWGRAFELQFVKLAQTAGGVTRSRDSRYTHDEAQRLTAITTTRGTATDTETFTLDAVANRTHHSRVSGDWLFDSNNRLTQRGSEARYRYDDNGNLIEKTEGATITRYTWDSLDRLIEVNDASSGTPKLIARYGYDPFNRRLWKEVYRDRGGKLLASARRTLFVYADEGLIAEASQAIIFNPEDNSVTATEAPVITTQYGPAPDAPFTTGMLFVKTKDSSNQDRVAYYHHDHLGTPILATDKEGRVVWAADHNVFGEATVITPTATAEHPVITSNLRLPGQYMDEETGFHYNWNRYYDPALGRYISSDPVGLAGGFNLYAYVSGRPLDYSDPEGLRKPKVSFCDAIGLIQKNPNEFTAGDEMLWWDDLGQEHDYLNSIGISNNTKEGVDLAYFLVVYKHVNYWGCGFVCERNPGMDEAGLAGAFLYILLGSAYSAYESGAGFDGWLTDVEADTAGAYAGYVAGKIGLDNFADIVCPRGDEC